MLIAEEGEMVKCWTGIFVPADTAHMQMKVPKVD